MKRKIGFVPKKIAVLTSAITVVLSASFVSAFAEESTSFTIDSVIDNIVYGEWNGLHDYVVDEPKIDKVSLPSKFDLRDVDGICYVPEIKRQHP